jgi:hypothetical protein
VAIPAISKQVVKEKRREKDSLLFSVVGQKDKDIRKQRHAMGTVECYAEVTRINLHPEIEEVSLLNTLAAHLTTPGLQ